MQLSGLDTDDSDGFGEFGGFGGLDEQVSLETRTNRENEPVESSEAVRDVEPDLEVDMTYDIEVTCLLRWEWRQAIAERLALILGPAAVVGLRVLIRAVW